MGLDLTWSSIIYRCDEPPRLLVFESFAVSFLSVVVVFYVFLMGHYFSLVSLLSVFGFVGL